MSHCNFPIGVSWDARAVLGGCQQPRRRSLINDLGKIGVHELGHTVRGRSGAHSHDACHGALTLRSLQ